ncbi:hypothetical protein WA026_013003 [Henosepilachna vigintioctopunctata]|uniref:Uncharacterized protein n=1 Tax=Henosepilachna vigintioctopunctata TaxID=420089 RepID=A0AAW1TU46_9CUCU
MIGKLRQNLSENRIVDPPNMPWLSERSIIDLPSASSDLLTIAHSFQTVHLNTYSIFAIELFLAMLQTDAPLVSMLSGNSRVSYAFHSLLTMLQLFHMDPTLGLLRFPIGFLPTTMN